MNRAVVYIMVVWVGRTRYRTAVNKVSDAVYAGAVWSN